VVYIGEEMSILWVIHWQKNDPAYAGSFFKEGEREEMFT
jgi:hypothetical protein